MEIPSQENKEEGEMPIPLNSTYVAIGSGSDGGDHGHMIHPHHHHHTSSTHNNNNHMVSNGPIISSSNNIIIDEDKINHNNHVVTNYNKKNMVKYRECLKNHAAAMGGNATDGCGEFISSGEEGTLEALTCSACNCHRNFHRKEIEGEPINSHQSPHFNRIGRKVFVGPHHHHHHKGILSGPDPLGYPISSRGVAPMIMSYNIGGSLLPYESDDQEEGGGGDGVGMTRVPPHHHQMMVKKRFRTKFTQEQKEKMLNFAEKVGWKIQRQEEAVVQQFCQEVGIKRRVLKVWMHNNKYNLAKKNNISDIAPNQVEECDPTMK